MTNSTPQTEDKTEQELIYKVYEKYYLQYVTMVQTLGIEKARAWLSSMPSIVRAVDEIVVNMDFQVKDGLK